MKLKILVGIASIVMLAGCANNQRIADETYESPSANSLVCKIPYQVTTVDPVTWRPYTWEVFNEQKINELQSQGASLNYVALTPTDFQNLSLNLVDMRRVMESQHEQIQQLIEYYQRDDEDTSE